MLFLRKGSIDKGILFSIITLSLLGVVFVRTSTFYIGGKLRGEEFLYNHLARLSLGLFLLFFLLAIPVDFLEKSSPLIFIFSIIPLVAVLFVGVEIRGARRWIDLGFISFQPSELAKFSLLFFLSYLISRRREYLRSFPLLLLPISSILLVCLLILIEPDVSTTCLVGFIAVSLLFVKGLKIRYLLFLLIPIIFFFYLVNQSSSISLLGKKFSHVRTRLERFLSQKENYQVEQAKIGIAEGKLLGVGIGRGKEKLLFLPFPHTDFIFAVVGEEMGFLGASLIIFLFLFLGVRGFKLALELSGSHEFASSLSFGITLSYLLYAFTHISYVLGFLPPTGLPLPFLSYGGSSLILNLASGGILLNFSKLRGKKR